MLTDTPSGGEHTLVTLRKYSFGVLVNPLNRQRRFDNKHRATTFR